MALWGRELDCLTEPGATTLPVYAVRPEGLDAFLAAVPDRAAAFLRESGFTASAGSVVLVPGGSGTAGAVLGLGGVAGPLPFGALPFALPEGSLVRFAGTLDSPEDAVLGFCMGAYRFDGLKSVPANRAPARLALPEGAGMAVQMAETIWLVRDLINMPANLLGPAELTDAAVATLRKLGADVTIASGDAVARDYPLIEAVGRGSARPPHVVVARWRGSKAHDLSPLHIAVRQGRRLRYGRL